MPELGNDGVENSVVAAVAESVSAADHGAVPRLHGAVSTADENFIVFLLPADHAIEGEHTPRLFIEGFAHLFASLRMRRKEA